jgi:hypothetical protein
VLACEVFFGANLLPRLHEQFALVRRTLPDGEPHWSTPLSAETAALAEMRELDAIAFTTLDGHLGAVDRATGELLTYIELVSDGVPCIGLSLAASGTQLAVGTLDGRIFIYDAQRIRDST